MSRSHAAGKIGCAERSMASGPRGGGSLPCVRAVVTGAACRRIRAASRTAWRRICAGAASLMTLALSGCGAFNPGEAGAVGIIGGADGPTSYFITTSLLSQGALTPLAVGLLVVLGIAVVVSAVILVRRARKNKK